MHGITGNFFLSFLSCSFRFVCEKGKFVAHLPFLRLNLFGNFPMLIFFLLRASTGLHQSKENKKISFNFVKTG